MTLKKNTFKATALKLDTILSSYYFKVILITKLFIKSFITAR